MKHQDATKRATIYDVARVAGVSRALVSLVLRGSPKVSAEKKQAVAEAIAALDYRPSNAARWLASGRTGIVGVLLDDLANPWFVELLDGLQSILGEQNMRMILSDPTYLARPGESPVSAFMDLRVDGLIIAGDIPADDTLLRATAQTPAVVAGVRAFQLPSADVVTNDDVAGARMAVEHLVGLGHQDITFLTAATGSAALRASSYRDTMTRHGLQGHIREIQTDLSEHSGFEAMTSLIESGRPPTAVLAANDVLAVGALSAADGHGITVPSQLSLVGYDNTYLAGIRHLSLTSVDPVSRDVGIRAAQRLLERMADPSLPQRTDVLTPELVIRNSTAPASRGRTKSPD